MDTEQIKSIKKSRDSISCSLSIIKRELLDDKLTHQQKHKRIERGLEKSIEFQRLTQQLIDAGCKLSAKSPYLMPSWWEEQKLTLPNQLYELKGPDIQTHQIHVPPTPQTVDFKFMIKEVMKETLVEFNKNFQALEPQTCNYILTIVYEHASDETTNLVISLLQDYLKEVNAIKIIEETTNQDTIITYRLINVTEKEFDIIKRTMLFFSDNWPGLDQNIMIFGKSEKIA